MTGEVYYEIGSHAPTITPKQVITVKATSTIPLAMSLLNLLLWTQIKNSD